MGISCCKWFILDAALTDFDAHKATGGCSYVKVFIAVIFFFTSTKSMTCCYCMISF